MKKSIFLKAVAVVFILCIGYHFSGVESVFCEDAHTSVATHDCSVCHHNIHEATPQTSFSVPIFISVATHRLTDDFLYTQTPSLVFLRPPISL